MNPEENAAASSRGREDSLDIDLDPDFLPELPARKIVPEGFQVMNRAWCVLQQVRWIANTPVTFADLGISHEDIKLLIGEQWGAVYKADPAWDVCVHPQILRLLACALEKLDAKFTELGEEEKKGAKRAATETMEALTKRRKLVEQKAKKQAKQPQA